MKEMKEISSHTNCNQCSACTCYCFAVCSGMPILMFYYSRLMEVNLTGQRILSKRLFSLSRSTQYKTVLPVLRFKDFVTLCKAESGEF